MLLFTVVEVASGGYLIIKVIKNGTYLPSCEAVI